MEKTKATEIFMQYQDRIPEDRKAYFKNFLDRVDDSCYDSLLSVNTHNPISVLLFSLFLGGFGVDRFIIGDIGLGIAKLLLGWCTFGLWSLIDIFLTYKKAKLINLNNLISVC